MNYCTRCQRVELPDDAPWPNMCAGDLAERDRPILSAQPRLIAAGGP